MKWLAFLLPFTLSLSAAAQTDKPSSTAQRPKSIPGASARVEGTVLNSLTGKPLDGVHVMLASYGAQHSSPDAAYGGMTSNGGHFSILRIPPARYLILPERPGFLFVPRTANRIAAHGWLEVKSGEQVRDLTLEMVPRAIISGRVLDEYGDPVMGIYVTAIPVSPQEDPGFVPHFITNDRGEFRIAVLPGKYYVKADFRFGPSPPRGPSEVRTDGTVEARYLETYYPGAAAVTEATPVETRAGRELSGVEVTLARSPVLAIRGTVSGFPLDCTADVQAFGRGRFDRSYFVSLYPDVDAARSGPRKFEIGHLTSGEYQVYAHAHCAAPESAWLSPTLEVTLTDSNVEDINLALAPGEDVAGAVEISGKPAKSSPGESWRVELQPMSEAVSWLRSRTDTAPDGSFTVKSVFPQRYRVDVSPLPENGFVKSVSMNETASSDRVVDLSGGAEGVKLKIILGLNGARVSGQVKNKDDSLAPFVRVVLLPDRDDDNFDSYAISETYSSAEGRYIFKGVAPGRYRFLAMKLLPGAISDYAQLTKHLAEKADIIEVKEGEELHKDLKLVDTEDTDAP